VAFDIADSANQAAPSSYYTLGVTFVAPPCDIDEILVTILEQLAGNVVISYNGRTGVVVPVAGDYTAAMITNTAAGSISSVTVQDALNELDTDKAPLASPTFTGVPTGPTANPLANNAQLATTAYVDAAVSTSAISDADYGDVIVSGSGTVWTLQTSIDLVGNPTTTTQAPGNDSTRIATTEFVTDAVATAVAGAVTDGDKGDITVSSSGTVWTVDNDVVTYAKMQNVSATDRLLGRDTASAGDVEELTVGGGLEFTGSGGIQVAADGVTYAKMQNVSAASRLLGRGSAGGAGDPEEITLGTGLSMSTTTLNASVGTAAGLVDTITFVIDGGGSAITTGVKGYLEIPFACTITQATLLADVSGSIVIDVWKDTYANFPPVDAGSITASAPPTISAAVKSQDATLTGWTTSVSAGDILGFNVDSATTVTLATLSLKIART
jgi:hypothetical protein